MGIGQSTDHRHSTSQVSHVWDVSDTCVRDCLWKMWVYINKSAVFNVWCVHLIPITHEISFYFPLSHFVNQSVWCVGWMSEPLLSRVWSCTSLGAGQNHLMAVKKEVMTHQQQMEMELKARVKVWNVQRVISTMVWNVNVQRAISIIFPSAISMVTCQALQDELQTLENQRPMTDAKAGLTFKRCWARKKS